MADSTYPKWVLDQRKPDIEVRKTRGFYCLYEMKCVYDKEKKKGRKPWREDREFKEYGITPLYDIIMPEYSGLLKKHFPLRLT